MLRAAAIAILCALFLPFTPVSAQPSGTSPQRLDDSSSPAARLMVTPRWMHDNAGRELSDDQMNALVAEVRGAEILVHCAVAQNVVDCGELRGGDGDGRLLWTAA